MYFGKDMNNKITTFVPLSIVEQKTFATYIEIKSTKKLFNYL